MRDDRRLRGASLALAAPCMQARCTRRAAKSQQRRVLQASKCKHLSKFKAINCYHDGGSGSLPLPQP
eukprot:9883072-Alexandrium_andersonii.AAC.1